MARAVEILHLLSNSDLLDVWIPGRKKQPDQAYRPSPRPQQQTLQNALLVNLIQMQPTVGGPWPTIVIEVGNSQNISSFLSIRDRALSYLTQINVVILVSYNRNNTRQTDMVDPYRRTRLFRPTTPSRRPNCVS